MTIRAEGALISGGAAALSAAGLEGDDEATQFTSGSHCEPVSRGRRGPTAVVNAKCISPSRSAPTC